MFVRVPIEAVLGNAFPHVTEPVGIEYGIGRNRKGLTRLKIVAAAPMPHAVITTASA